MRVEGFKNGGGAEETNVYGARLHQIGPSELLKMRGRGWAGSNDRAWEDHRMPPIKCGHNVGFCLMFI